MLAKTGDLQCGSVTRGVSDEPAPSGPTARPEFGIRRTRRRSNRRTAWRMAAACVSAVAVFSAAACGSSPSSSSPSSSASSSGAGSSELAQGMNVAAAKAALVPYTNQPSAFPVTEPLTKKLPAGKKFVFLQCSTPVCALAGKLLQPAVKAIGGTFTAVDAGTTAQASQAAASSVLALKPDAVLYSGYTPALFGGGLKAISGAGIKVVSISISTDVKPYGITFNYIGPDTTQLYGKLLADWVVVNKGANADAVFYGVPALDLSPSVQKAFEDELHKNCASCKARTVPIDASTIGKTSAATVVSDLQAHPSTNVAVFVSFQVAAGLPAAMKIAGLSVPTVGFAPTPGNLQDLKNGGLTAALAIDFPVSVWTAVDAAARLIQGAQPTSGEKAGEVPLQFLAKKDITFDPTNGWSGYPDFSQRFAMLWQTS